MISELHAMELKQNMILSPGTTGELGQAGISQFSNCWDGDPAVQAITDGTDVVGGGVQVSSRVSALLVPLGKAPDSPTTLCRIFA